MKELECARVWMDDFMLDIYVEGYGYLDTWITPARHAVLRAPRRS